jgi:hypothetical protein
MPSFLGVTLWVTISFITGIADGVGGWAGVKGSNAALYSLKMMHYAGIQLEHYDDISGEYDNDLIDYEIVTPADILAKSYLQVNADARKENIIGSTTALIVMLRVEFYINPRKMNCELQI